MTTIESIELPSDTLEFGSINYELDQYLLNDDIKLVNQLKPMFENFAINMHSDIAFDEFRFVAFILKNSSNTMWNRNIQSHVVYRPGKIKTLTNPDKWSCDFVDKDTEYSNIFEQFKEEIDLTVYNWGSNILDRASTRDYIAFFYKVFLTT